MTKPTIYTSVKEHVYVAGRDPEHADMSNPRGEFYGSNFYVEAEQGGECFAHFHKFETRDEAEAFHSVIQDEFKDGTQMNMAHWKFSRIPYGAPGWNDQEIACEIDDARAAGERHPMDR